MASSDPIIKTIDLWREIQWFAIHAKPRRENFASSNVTALGIETLLPRVKVERLEAGVARLIVKPLFPSYFFARFCPRNSLESVAHTQGVLRVVSSGRFPIPVGDAIIREIQDRVEQDGLVRMDGPIFNPGVRVSIQGGPFEGLMGRVERESNDRRRVAILLETLSNARVLMERRWLQLEAA